MTKSRQEILNQLQEVVSKEPSTWFKEAEFRADNKDWIHKSQAVAVKILRALRDKKMSQKNLATLLNVSPQQVNKWVKGKVNFTFETISKLERALGISIIEIPLANPQAEPTKGFRRSSLSKTA